MRKLDKTQLIATAYKNWLDALPAEQSHPPYNSSSGAYYHDIVANLNWIQKGLCAYTEEFMQQYEHTNPTNWNNGRFRKFDCDGQLDHYNPALKANQGWLWDNFFLINGVINSKKVKGAKKPNGILKPDKPNFEPSFWLEYNIERHVFIPNRNRTIEEQEAILHDIDTLGLNWDPIKTRRQLYLNKIIRPVKEKIKTYTEAFEELHQFFTAFILCKEYMES
jgi:hypothetical protein